MSEKVSIKFDKDDLQLLREACTMAGGEYSKLAKHQPSGSFNWSLYDMKKNDFIQMLSKLKKYSEYLD